MTDVYAAHAHDYLRAGWTGVLPLRPQTKWPPPKGFTGYDGEWPYAADVQSWCETYPDGNVALRLPEDNLGIDVDAYSDKPGGQTLAELEDKLGPLPPTVVSTSRTDSVSGIRVYRIPPHPNWPNQAGPGIELIHFGHRYAVVWPSTHPEGRIYRWIDQRTGEVLVGPPHKNTVPALPTPWVEYLQEHARANAVKADIGDSQVTDWLAKLRTGNPCDKVIETTAAAATSLTSAAVSRHDTMTTATARLIAYGSWGHAGVVDALAHLRGVFLEETTKPGAGQRHQDEAVAEWRRAITGAVAMHHLQRPEPAQQCSCPLPAFDPDLEAAFWKARPELDHIRQFARARRTSPWAVLAVVLVRMTVTVPPDYVLPAIIGGQASLNLFVGIVASSGGGKGAAEAAATDAVTFSDDIHTVGVGSGEGILHQYVRYVPENKKTGEPARIHQHNDAVLFTASEVDTLGALHQRQGSTLLPELRKVYMGEELSFAYVDPTKRLKVGRHRYRAGLIAGIQPSRAGVLLDDADGGTPQRFLWVPGTDADMPDTAPDEPDPITWARPTSLLTSASGKVVVPVCATARDTIDAEHVKRNRGDGDALDGHALLTRLKWAAALGFLDGRIEVSEEDWQLAGTVMAMSDHTRDNVIHELRDRKRAANEARGIEYGHREAIKDETVEEAAVHRVARKIVRKLEGAEPTSRSDLRRSISSRDRGYFDEAIDRLIEAGQVELEEDIRGTSYRQAGRVA